MTATPDPSDFDAGQDAQARARDLAELLAYAQHTDDEEKRKLARQLHDKLGSSLTALSMHLSMLLKLLPAEPDLEERSTMVRQLLAKIVEGNRALQASLWNDTFEFLGIKAALQELATGFGEQHALAVRTSLPAQDLDCPRDCGIVLLRAAQEGLRNIAAHAAASDVALELLDDAAGWTLTLRDNGKGLQGAAPISAHHGLRLLQERVRRQHGRLALQANPAGSAGACLVVQLPRPARA